MPKHLEHLDLRLELLTPHQLESVKLHRRIFDIMPAVNEGFELLLSSLGHSRQPDLSATHPLIIWEDSRGNRTLVTGFLYYYESIFNNVDVYANIRRYTPREAERVAWDDAVMNPLGYHCALGKKEKVARDAKKTRKSTATSGQTAWSQLVLMDIFGPSDSLDFHLNTRALASAIRAASILHVSPETICRYLEDMDLRQRRLQTRPKPRNNGQKSMF
jgi:hypothetical protein